MLLQFRPDIIFPFDKIIIACVSLLTSPYIIIIIIIGTRLHVWNLIFSGIYKTLQPVLTRAGDDSNYHTICMTFMFIFALYSPPRLSWIFCPSHCVLLAPSWKRKNKKERTCKCSGWFRFWQLPDSLGWSHFRWIRISLARYGPPTANADRRLTEPPFLRSPPMVLAIWQTHSEAIKPPGIENNPNQWGNLRYLQKRKKVKKTKLAPPNQNKTKTTRGPLRNVNRPS